MQRHPDTAAYVISVAAELAGVHPQTLRHYELKGLLDPARSAGGTRRYSDRDLARLRRITELTALGVNLEGVRLILELEHENETLRATSPPPRTGRAERHHRELAPPAARAPWRVAHPTKTDGRLPVGDGTSPPPVARR